MVALHAPIAPQTFEVRAQLAGSLTTPSQRFDFNFAKPIEIVGMNPIVVPTTSTAVPPAWPWAVPPPCAPRR